MRDLLGYNITALSEESGVAVLPPYLLGELALGLLPALFLLSLVEITMLATSNGAVSALCRKQKCWSLSTQKASQSFVLSVSSFFQSQKLSCCLTFFWHNPGHFYLRMLTNISHLRCYLTFLIRNYVVFFRFLLKNVKQHLTFEMLFNIIK